MLEAKSNGYYSVKCPYCKGNMEVQEEDTGSEHPCDYTACNEMFIVGEFDKWGEDN